jgi:hypothetical protein
VHTFVNDLLRPVGTYLYGRRMYETMVGWETVDTPAQAPLLGTLRMQTRFSVMAGHVMLWPDAIQPSLLDEFSRNLAER